jgi:putative ABC transport system ATP-binding protein
MITLHNITKRFGDYVALDDVSVEVPDGSLTALLGPSGSGKSTLLRVISGMQRPAAGDVAIDGVEVATASWRSAGDPRVSLIHQDYRLVPFLTVEQNMLLAAELRGVRRSRADVGAMLDRVGLPPSMGRRLPTRLSGGQQQRVAIARALLAGTSVLLADEPTGALDVDNTVRIADILVELGRRDGLVVVVATHDPRVAERLDHRVQLAGGKLVAAP